MPITVAQLTPADHGAWDEYVDHHPDATCYHLRAWQVAAERAYGLRTPFLVAREGQGGPVRGVLPLFRAGGPLSGHLITGLFGAYGRVLADTREAGAALLLEAQRLTRRLRASYLMFKSLGDDPVLSGLTRHETSVMATLPLDPDPQQVWRRFRDKMRNAIRKAQKSQLLPCLGLDQLPAYYDVLAENMHRKGTPIYGLSFMRELVLALGEYAEVLTLLHEGRVVSAGLCVFFRDTVAVPFASSRPSAFHLNPNNLLYWEVIQRACQRGMKTLDFGRSPKDSSTLAFKLGWGAQITPVPFYVYTVKNSGPSLDAETPGVQRLIRLWQRLPRNVADTIGPMVCRRWLL